MNDQCLQGWSIEEVCNFPIFESLKNSFILSLNVKVCVRFIVFLQISLFFQELCWMICALASHHHVICFQSGGSKKSEDWGGGLKILGLGHYQFGQVIFGGSVPHYMPCLLCHFNFINLLQTAISNTIHLFRSSIRVIYVLKNLSF